MHDFKVPVWQIDPGSLPPLLMTSEPDSFAFRSFKYRIPLIVEETIRLNRFPQDIRQALQALRSEILGGNIRGLEEETPDRAFWDEVSRPYLGHSWFEAPWYWAEAFFYRRILEATRYFQPGPWQGFDPYQAKKQTEWQPEAAPRLVDALLSQLPEAPQTRFETLIYASLWGNRVDLSYDAVAHVGRASRPDDVRDSLLVDDTPRLWDYLTARARRRLAVVADNTGTELLMDLALADFLLDHRLVEQVVFHLKPQPFYVSDAMPADVQAGVAALPSGGPMAAALSQRLHHYLAEGRLVLESHWVYATSLFYCQLPDDLRARLAEMDLVLLKGDVNYRRTVIDVHWPPTIPYAEVTAYYPTALASLRTLKGELIVGLKQGQAEQLYGEDPDWLVNGKRGVIQARL